MTRRELLSSPGYWIGAIQIEIYNIVQNYINVNNLSISDFAKLSSVSEKKIQKLLDGDYDGKISELCQICIACGYGLNISMFKKIEDILDEENRAQERYK